MTAAHVINPAALSAFCPARTSSPSTLNRNLPCGRQLNRIKRDLFGPTNTSEINQIFAQELEKYQEKAIQKWGFDFRAGTPLDVNSQYVWERVSFQESSYAPEVYTLTRAAHVRPTPNMPSALDMLLDERAERENSYSTATDTDSCDDSQDESTSASSSLVVFKMPALVECRSGGAEASGHSYSLSYGQSALRKRQPKITEYMKERKRLAQTPKKFSPPSKRMRTSSGGSSSSSSSSTAIPQHYLRSAHHSSASTQQPSSVDAHFSLHMMHHN